MREGYYSITYMGATGASGFGMLALDNGEIIGADAGGVKYDGTYIYNEATKALDAKLTLTVPAGGILVMGSAPQDHEWQFDFDASFPRETSETPILIQTQFGPVNVIIRYIRGFPD